MYNSGKGSKAPKYKIPYVQKESGKKIWERENAEDIKKRIEESDQENLDNGKAKVFNFYSKTCGEMWNELDEEERDEYNRVAMERNEQVGSLEVKRE